MHITSSSSRPAGLLRGFEVRAVCLVLHGFNSCGFNPADRLSGSVSDHNLRPAIYPLSNVIAAAEYEPPTAATAKYEPAKNHAHIHRVCLVLLFMAGSAS